MKLEWNLARDAKNNRKGFYRFVNQKKVKESVFPPDNAENLVTVDKEKAETPKKFLTQSSTSLPTTLRLTESTKGIEGAKWDSRMVTGATKCFLL